ncbi:hypothetical protein LOY67_12750 [Pseudomonas sp. B21-056]|uniref:hypothetical protein n=1 Tax=Pseudomonas sp. B21-056 TaxID=2895495 RepID=UPI00223029EB|nr:hypothetical protein [Pseudomonas sp. B21-056]UZE26230.1 hypothetical protein LOY67_12750 [Pseudomonas sp. B21-056]
MRALNKFTLSFLAIMAASTEQVFAQECDVTLTESNRNVGYLITLKSKTKDTRIITLEATCPRSSQLVVSIEGELGDAGLFAQTGPLNVRLSHTQLDGRYVDLAQPRSSKAPRGAYASSVMAVPGDLIIPIVSGRPVKGRVLTMQIEVSAVKADGLLSFLVNGY